MSVLLLTACSEEPALRIGSNQWPGYEPVYLARELGDFARSEVRLVELPSATDVMQYLRNGNLDGGMLTLDEALTLMAEGVPLRAVLVLDVSNGADAVLAHPQFKNLSDLKGRRVGVEISALGAVMLESLLEAADLHRDDIEVVPLTVDRQRQAFLDHAVDAVITFEPTLSQLRSLGAVTLFDSSRIPGRIVDVLVLREDILDEQAGHVRALLDGYFQARRYLDEQPATAIGRMAPRVHMNNADFRTALAGIRLPDLDENRQLLGGSSPRLTATAEDLLTLMVEWKLVESTPDVARLADDRFLPGHR